MYKIVINKQFGMGFNLSTKARELYAQRKGIHVNNVCSGDIPRHDPVLVQIVEELGKEANPAWTRLKVVTITSKQYRVSDYDGYDIVETPEDINWITIEE